MKTTKRMSKFIQKHLAVSLAIIFFIFIPFILQISLCIFSWGIFSSGSNDGWLGFWGGYLGSTLAIGFAYFNTKYQLNESKQNDFENAVKINELNSLSSLLNNSMGFLSRIYELENAIQIFNSQNNMGNNQSSDQPYTIINNFQKYWRDYVSQYNSRITSLNHLTSSERKHICSSKINTGNAHTDLEKELRKEPKDYNSIVEKKNLLKDLIIKQINSFDEKYKTILSSDFDLNKQSPK